MQNEFLKDGGLDPLNVFSVHYAGIADPQKDLRIQHGLKIPESLASIIDVTPGMYPDVVRHALKEDDLFNINIELLILLPRLDIIQSLIPFYYLIFRIRVILYSKPVQLFAQRIVRVDQHPNIHSGNSSSGISRKAFHAHILHIILCKIPLSTQNARKTAQLAKTQ